MQKFAIFVVLIILVYFGEISFSEESTLCVNTNTIFTLVTAFFDKMRKTFTLRFVDPKPKVYYYLFTRQNPYHHQELLFDNSKYLETSHFNKSWPTRFIVSGWLNVHNSCAVTVIKDAYMKKGDFNVITVGWDEASNDIDYIYLSLTISRVAKQLAAFTKYLNTIKHVPFSDMYVIGFSLGAQIAGLAGKQISPNKFKTIFALEPAGPMFHGLGFDGRVDAGDAEYVESIQTNIGIAGYYGESGRASFFPNYGNNQPHCSLGPVCNHAAAYEYFAESINAVKNSEFIGTKCESFAKLAVFNICNCTIFGRNNCNRVRMGGEPAIPKQGIYFLRTNRNSPYARGNIVH